MNKACLFRILFAVKSNKTVFCHIPSPYTKAVFFSTTTTNGFTSQSPLLDVPEETKEVAGSPKCAADVFRYFGFPESYVDLIFSRQPSLRNAAATNLENKLTLLKNLGLTTAQLVNMIYCHPCILKTRLNRLLDHRLDHLQSLFGSKEFCIKAIAKNPSLLLYDFQKDIKPVFSLYEKMGLTKSDIVSMVLLRPTLIPRTYMSDEKLDYIARVGISKESKMFKYLVTIIGVSRLETIREKVANLESFGLSEDEVLKLFGRSPVLMTLSVDKVQRNMTFLIGTMKLPPKTVCDHPFLLSSSLEVILKPRVFLAVKMRDMNLCPQISGSVIIRALRMPEKRFLKVFVECQEEEVRVELLSYYSASKGMERLAKSSKKASYTLSFPF